MKIQLSDHFTYRKLFSFALPSIIMMVFTSIYGVVDGFFVSNYAGKTAFAAINFIMPYVMILASTGFIIGTGGSALIGKTLGEGDKEKANSLFSLLIYISILFSIALAFVGVYTTRPVAVLLGADEQMADIACQYAKVAFVGLPMVTLQYEFHAFCVVSEKPKLGLFATLAAGFANMILDYLLVGKLNMGVEGAAAATVASQCFGGGIPLVYFFSKNSSLLRLGKANIDLKALWKTLTNGSSEFVSNISMSVVGMLYNLQLMKYSGENGVAAYGVLMYVNMIFIAIFIGYSIGTAPIISYNFGAKNKAELKGLFKKSLRIISVFSFLMLICGEFAAKPLSSIFVGYDEGLMQLTVNAFRIFSISFLFVSVPIFGSSFFTALNDGLISAAISFLRTLVFQIVAVLVFPIIFGIDGIWYSIIAAEVVAATVTIIFWITKQKKYGY